MQPWSEDRDQVPVGFVFHALRPTCRHPGDDLVLLQPFPARSVILTWSGFSRWSARSANVVIHSITGSLTGSCRENFLIGVSAGKVRRQRIFGPLHLRVYESGAACSSRSICPRLPLQGSARAIGRKRSA